MRDALSKILIEVIIFALAYAAKVDVNENNREIKKAKDHRTSFSLLPFKKFAHKAIVKVI